MTAPPDTEPEASVLLVDDQPANLVVLEALLDGMGLNLVRARSGEEALRRLLGQDFAAVLLDLNMPGMDGFETARLIRGRKRSAHTPIIFLTAFEMPQFPVSEAYRLGAVDYLVKPLVPEILRAKVAVFVDLFRKTEQVRRLERRRAQEELARATLILSGVRDSVILTDLDGVVTYWNEGATRLFGWTAAEMVGRPLTDRVPEAARPEMARWTARIREGEKFAGEWLDYRKDGSPVWIDARVSRFTDADGRPAGILGLAHDISDRKEAEQALRASEERLRAVIDNSPAFIFLKDAGGRYRMVNQAFAAYAGKPREEIHGRTDRDLFPAEVADRIGQDDRDILASGAARQYEEVVPVAGVPHTFLTVKFPLRDAAGTPNAVCGIATDITDRIRMEEALREADRRKDEFLAMLAHELRNPLAPVLTGLKILSLDKAGPEAKEQARAMVERQARHLARLVDDLLDVSRITRGKVQLRPEPLDLARLVRTAAEDRRAALEQAGLALAVDVPERPVPVRGDPTRLAQALANLLDNAAKFTPRGGAVAVRLAADGAAGRAVLTVRDTGTGIEPEVLARLFQPFAQGDRTLERSKGGLGLGLAVVKGLVELHGGTVEAASAGPGRGAEFTLRLPLEPGPERPA